MYLEINPRKEARRDEMGGWGHIPKNNVEVRWWSPNSETMWGFGRIQPLPPMAPVRIGALSSLCEMLSPSTQGPSAIMFMLTRNPNSLNLAHSR